MDDTPTLYEVLKAAGCDLDSHESDLYVKDTPEAREIVGRYCLPINLFVSPIDKKMRIELPFMNQPFWEAKERIWRKPPVH